MRAEPAPLVGGVLALAVVAACTSSQEPGEWGVLRYFAEVEGQAPLRLIPPITDRDGNVYVLYGNRTRAEVAAFIGHADGDWTSGCELHKGDTRGVHGWAGHDEDRAWYWSGDALVEVSGRFGECELVLDRDPTSSADLRFLGVFPHVEDSPSATELPAMIISPSDATPFHVTVDLDLGQYKGLQPFEPSDATDVVVVGVGAHPTEDEIYAIVTYERDSVRRVEARFMNRGGSVNGMVAIEGFSSLFELDAVVGYLESGGGVVAGLLYTGELVVFTRDWARVEEITGWTPHGVHRWEDQLWLVGVGPSGGPVLAAIDSNGQVGPLERWVSSDTAHEALQGGVEVLDERSNPTQQREWDAVVSAIGPFPLLSAHTPDTYATGTTGWLVAGPYFDSGPEGMTAVAFGPVGLSYP